MFYLTIALAALAAAAYHIGQKAIPARANPMLSLIVSYLTALVMSMVLLPLFPRRAGLGESLRELNWGTYAVGVSIVGVELAYLLAYRLGWKISLASVTSNVATAVLLVLVGVLAYSERLSLRHAAGLALCLVGLALVGR